MKILSVLRGLDKPTSFEVGRGGPPCANDWEKPPTRADPGRCCANGRWLNSATPEKDPFSTLHDRQCESVEGAMTQQHHAESQSQNSSATSRLRARAMRWMLTRLALRSPCSMAPIQERSRSQLGARASWARPRSLRSQRSRAPKRRWTSFAPLVQPALSPELRTMSMRAMIPFGAIRPYRNAFHHGDVAEIDPMKVRASSSITLRCSQLFISALPSRALV